MAWQERERAPKPFGFVTPGRPSRRAPPGHERWSGDYTGTFECTLATLTPLHVGSGLFRLAGGKVIKEMARSGDELVVPGSSLKGAFRSAAEAISASCTATDRRQACREPGALCVACRIFGGLGYLGRVRFTDARLRSGPGASEHDVPTLFAPKRGLAGWKFYQHGQPAAGGEPWEVVVEGTRFEFGLEVESLAGAELCLVLTAMGAFGDLTPKLGGGKPRGLGSVRVEVASARLRQVRQAALTYDAGVVAMPGAHLLQQVGRAKGLIDQQALAQLRTLWAYPGPGQAPSGVY
ncbi:MAG: hypothetical protein HY690_18775 [Chloroflexi bacterium]|nr:hypothetical protein [Chloroflexota bacterium]